MSDDEAAIAKALEICTFLPASWDKRFARDMAFAAKNSPERVLTEKQRASLLRLAIKYRRQLPTEIVILAQDGIEENFSFRTKDGTGQAVHNG